MNFNGRDVSSGATHGAVVIGVRVAEGCANSIFFWFVFFYVTNKSTVRHRSVRRFFVMVDEEVCVGAINHSWHSLSTAADFAGCCEGPGFSVGAFC